MDLTYYVIQPLIANIKTGNVWHDCLLIMLAMFCLSFISKSCTSVIASIQAFMSSITWRRLKARYSINIIVNPNDTLNTSMQVVSRNVFKLYLKDKNLIFYWTGTRRIFGSSSSSSYGRCEYMLGQIHPY
jgi:hypothetical protein